MQHARAPQCLLIALAVMALSSCLGDRVTQPEAWLHYRPFEAACLLYVRFPPTSTNQSVEHVYELREEQACLDARMHVGRLDVPVQMRPYVGDPRDLVSDR